MNKLLTWAVIAVVLGGCGGGKITKRHQSLRTDEIHKGADPYVAVSAFPAPPAGSSSAPQPIVLQLTEKGQRAYIEAVEGKDLGEINTHMSARFASPPGGAAPFMGGRPQAGVRVVLSAAKQGDAQSQPAGRIAGLEYTLKAQRGYEFLSWDAFETKYATVDLGELKRTSDGSFNAKLSPTLGGSVIGTGEVGGTYQEKLEETLVLRDRIVELTGSLQPKSATLALESGMGLDLVGNTVVNMTLSFDSAGKIRVSSIVNKSLFTDDTRATPIADRDVELRWPRLYEWPDLPQRGTLDAKLEGEYWYREVRSGDGTIYEGDDHATMWRGETATQTVTLLDKRTIDEMSAGYVLFFIEPDVDDAQYKNVALATRDNRGNVLPLAFGSYKEAAEFRDWINKTNATSVGSPSRALVLVDRGWLLNQENIRETRRVQPGDVMKPAADKLGPALGRRLDWSILQVHPISGDTHVHRALP